MPAIRPPVSPESPLVDRRVFNMANSARSAIQKRIDKIQLELNDLHVQMNELFGDVEAREFALQELEAVKKTLPDEDGEERQPQIALRKGSDASKARDALREARKPLHVDALLSQLGKEVNRKTRASLAGQLAFYARKNQIFVKTGPNEFGLLEWTNEKAFKSDAPFMVKVDLDSEGGAPVEAHQHDGAAANSNELESAA